jgi:hypothetical protein
MIYDGKNWRLVHDGVTVIAVLPGEGKTNTDRQVIERPTEAECLAEADKLGLVPLANAQAAALIEQATALIGEQPVADLARTIAALTKRVEADLPAVRNGLDGEKILAQAQANLDRQIEQTRSALAQLTDLAKQFDEAK